MLPGTRKSLVATGLDCVRRSARLAAAGFVRKDPTAVPPPSLEEPTRKRSYAQASKDKPKKAPRKKNDVRAANAADEPQKKKRKTKTQLSTSPIPLVPLTASKMDTDGVRRCWGDYSSSDPSMRLYHDLVWGRAETRGREVFKMLTMQIFQCGLSWKTVLKTEAALGTCFDDWSYASVARWSTAEIDRAASNPNIIKSRAKIKATVVNARAAVALDGAGGPSGFVRFVWDTLQMPDNERLLQGGTADGSYMRSHTGVQELRADGVHPTVRITAAVAVFKQRGFTFLGPATMLSFAQAIGACNHHKPDCHAFATCETAFRDRDLN
eukprot:gnl/Spiro4/21246_TR10374_c0_g1_i1.p1 gnl/Spiro4/21246_TR10374_c0_g1~~gnl/Spiro4/21246_TR10374_c0_g1_i1.p1  ORF type:complete len:333 (-),score=96.58 gnl/Spiro4/21246_TR10374_c0_g1_i1:81-1052(-)